MRLCDRATSIRASLTPCAARRVLNPLNTPVCYARSKKGHDMNRQQALRLPNYVKRFGPVAGLRLGTRIGAARGAASDAAQPVAVPGFERPLYLRPTVSDHSIFWQCVVRAPQDFRHLRIARQ
jgi:hypothetical protein